MRFAIITDIHEDVIHLELALNKIEKLGVDSIICLGDISGFSLPYYHHQQSRNASKCLALIREKCSHIVRGNHDLYAVQENPLLNPDFQFPDDWYQMNYQERKKIAETENIWLHEENDLSALYSREECHFIKQLPEYSVVQTENYSILLTHYLYPNVCGVHRNYYSEASDFEKHFQFMEEHHCKLAFAGHTHNLPGKVVSRKAFLKKRKTYYPEKDELVVLCPPIVEQTANGRFTLFDSLNHKLEFIRL
jgi:predicted phosphodiesterase